MSGGQDEASEYIQTGGVNVFKKTERTKCGNCVYWDRIEPSANNGVCHRWPPIRGVEAPVSYDWCGEFVDREPEAKPAEPQPAGEPACPGCGMHEPFCDCPEGMYDKKVKPAGELREWWVELKHDDDSCWAWCNEKFALSSADEDDEIIHVREVPSPERVREALDVFATGSEWPNWELLSDRNHRLKNRVLTLLRSLGIDTEGV